MRGMNSTSEHHPWKHREMIDGALMQLFKFWENGRPAFLNINTHGGQAWINFSGSLGFHSEHEQSQKFSTPNMKIDNQNETILVKIIEDICDKLDKTIYSSFKKVAVNEFDRFLKISTVEKQKILKK